MTRKSTDRLLRSSALMAVSPAITLALFVGTPGALAAPNSTAPGTAVAGAEGAPTTPGSYQAPTAQDLAAKQAEALALAAQVTDVNAALTKAQANVADLQAKLEKATADEEAAAAKAKTARAEEATQKARLDAAAALVGQRRGESGQWAAETYRNGQLGDIEKMMSLLQSSNTDDMAQRLQMLDLVGRWRGSVVDTVEEARAVQADATNRAKSAADEAIKAETDAAAAKQSAQSAVQAQTTQLMVINQLLTKVRADSSSAQAQASSMAQSLTQSMMGGSNNYTTNDIVGPVDPTCPGANLSGYSNGQIPTTALCKLWGTTGHYLRADAAKGFNDMSAAYAAQFGAPICITDSYRPYEVQVRLKAQKPHLAATPGRSNHGWARAVDLCGGLQNFGTPQHEWMRQNAPRFGWCDPVWARANGSKPEPWHWQYLQCSG